MRSATGQSGTDLDLLDELEERMKRLRIESSANSPDLVIHGNAFQGYAVNVPICEGSGGTPVPETGACCLPDGTCEEVTPSQCIIDGGTFLGGSCDPSPCPGACCESDGTCDELSESDCDDAGGTFQGAGTDCGTTGACCMGTDCVITTEDCCSNIGGTYQGDDTTCDPNPCEVPPCPGCGFVNPLGDGRNFLTATQVQEITIWSPAFPDCTTHCTGSQTHAYDPDTCIETCVSPGYDVDDSGCDPPSHFAGCGGFTCVGVYAGCSYSPGSHVSGNSVIFEYFCPDGCTIGGGTTCEHGIVTTTYSDECTPV